MQFEEKDIELWKSDIQDYHRGRKDRGYVNPKVEIVTQKIKKAQEKIFDPVL